MYLGSAEISREEGHAVTAHLSVLLSIDMLLTLANQKITCDKNINELKSLTKRVKELLAKRNKVIHANWNSELGVDSYFSVFARHRARGELKTEWVIMSAEDIFEIGDEIRRLFSDFLEFMKKEPALWTLS